MHRAGNFLEGHSPHASHEARAPKGPLVNSRCQGVESHGLQLSDVGGNGDALEVCLLDGLVRLFKEQGDPSTPAHRAAYWGAAHDGAQGYLVRLCEVPVLGYVDGDVCLWQVEA